MAKKIVTNVLGFAAGIVVFRLIQLAETGLYSFSVWLMGGVNAVLQIFFPRAGWGPAADHNVAGVLVAVLSVCLGWLLCWLISAPTQKGRVPALIVLGPAMAFVMALNFTTMLTYTGTPVAVWLQACITWLGAAAMVLTGIFGKSKSPFYRRGGGAKK